MASTILNDNSMDLQEEVAQVILPESAMTTTGDLRNQYAQNMAKAPFNDNARALEIQKAPLEQPIYEPSEYGEDDLPNRRELLREAMDATMDIATLDNSIVCAANKYARLIANTIGRLNEVKKRLKQDQQKQQDIQFLKSAYKGLSNVVNLTNENMTGSYVYTNNTFMSAQTSVQQVLYEVEKITGNGYSGNDYVLDKEGAFIKHYNDCSQKGYITDDSLLTTYEYSRLCSKSGKYYYKSSAAPSESQPEPQETNHDDKDVVCTIQMVVKKNASVNMLKLDAGTDDIKIMDVQISNDGKKYHSALSDTIDLSEDMYHAMNYVPGSDIVCFPSTGYLSLTLSSSHINIGEKLGMQRIETVNGEPAATIYNLDGIVRKVIPIDGIRLFSCSYTDSVLHSENVCPENGCKRVAVFCNQYVPDDARRQQKIARAKQDDAIVYTLFINGQPYVVQPINSDKDGIKMISCEENSYGESNVEFIGEPIKTVQLQIEINSGSRDATAFIGNLKICIG